MIRLSANLSKKVPLPGVQFSSQQYGAAMEIEVGDGDKPEAIKERIRELYRMLSNAIDEQIGGASAGQNSPTLPPSDTAPRNGNGHSQANNRAGRATGNGRRVTATEAQCRAIHAICKCQGIDVNTARNVLSWLRRIGAILGRSLSRPFEPIRDLFRTLVLASQMRLKPVGNASLPNRGKGRKHPMNGRSFGVPRPSH